LLNSQDRKKKGKKEKKAATQKSRSISGNSQREGGGTIFLVLPDRRDPTLTFRKNRTQKGKKHAGLHHVMQKDAPLFPSEGGNRYHKGRLDRLLAGRRRIRTEERKSYGGRKKEKETSCPIYWCNIKQQLLHATRWSKSEDNKGGDTAATPS